MSTPTEEVPRKNRSYARNLLVSVTVLSSLFFFTVLFLGINRQGRAARTITIDSEVLIEGSEVIEAADTVAFLVESTQGKTLFETQNKDAQAAFETLQKTVQYKEDDLVKDSESDELKKLLPEDTFENTELVRSVDDSEDPFLKERGFNLKNKHYIFEQTIEDIPVHGSHLSVHLKNGDEVYRMSGNLLTSDAVAATTISDEQAKARALEAARQDVLSPTGDSIHGGDQIQPKPIDPSTLKIHSVQQEIVNERLLGKSDDDTNYPALGVNIDNSNSVITYAKRFYVDLNSGRILFVKPLFAQAVNRQVYDCEVNPQNCPLVRGEGAGTANRGDADRAYDLFGQIYDFHKNRFTRDGYDNQGSALKILVNLRTQICPNAFWLYAPYRQFEFCLGMVTPDITAHEFGHAIVETTAGLPVQDVGGTLNENIADMFGYAFDNDDWGIGEGSPMGTFRRIDDPTQTPTNYGGPQPDRLFATTYYCGTNQSQFTHHNLGVFNKAYYLMISGGSFNGCQIEGQGLDKAIAIAYRATTTYLGPTANFRAMYDAMMRACTDLYQESSATCQNVKKALQATEVDQMTLNDQVGPVCRSQQAQAPACRTALQPTATPTPTGIQPTSTPTPTGVEPSATPTPTVPVNPSPTPEGQGTPTPTPVRPTLTPTPAQNVDAILDMAIVMAGVYSKPGNERSRITVKVKLDGPLLQEPLTQNVTFGADDLGIWRGAATFKGIPEGDGYTVFVKGPKHIQKRVCETFPRENFPGQYDCRLGKIYLKGFVNELDFTAIYLLGGDLPWEGQQDGVVNAIDLVSILLSLGRTDEAALEVNDINFDGIVDTQDYSLALFTLSWKFDQE